MEPQALEKKTSSVFIWTRILEAPFWTIYGMLIFILCKSLHAPPLQYTLLIALKPLVSLVSPYWSALIHKRPDRLRLNVILADLIAHIPFFFFPFIQNTWFIVGSGALFFMMKRGIIPAWMEILKLNLPQKKREKTFSYGSTLSYLVSIVLPFLFGRWMDLNPKAWTLLFPLAALLSLCGTALLLRISLSFEPQDKSITNFSLKNAFLKPWKNAWHLYKTRPDFTRFQVGFMLGGGGLMIMQPAMPAFFDRILHLSYTEIALAISTFKGIGFALTSRLWANRMNRFGIYRFSSFVTLLAALFPCALLLGQFQLPWIYGAFLIYGVMKAGSDLSWNLSGPIFAKEEDSSVYSSVNVVTVGIRGLFAPFLGSALCGLTSPVWALFVGGILCSIASLQLNLFQRRTSFIKE